MNSKRISQQSLNIHSVEEHKNLFVCWFKFPMPEPSSYIAPNYSCQGSRARKRRGPGGPRRFIGVRACVSVCVCLVSNSFLDTPRIGTKFVFVDRVSTREWADCHGFLSLLSLDRAATVQTYHPTQKLSIFQFPFASIRRASFETCSRLGKRRIDRSTSKRSS